MSAGATPILRQSSKGFLDCGTSSKDQPISLHEPDFTGTQAWNYVKDCLDTGWVSTAGHWVTRFEEKLCSTTAADHAVVVSNGTVALRLALHLVGVGPGDEVLLPPLSFVATANAVAHLGAVPHFVDIEQDTIGLCPVVLATRLEAIAEAKAALSINWSSLLRCCQSMSSAIRRLWISSGCRFGACPLLKMLLKPLLVGGGHRAYLVLLGYLVSMETS